MSIRFGVSPIAWANDDMPELGGDTSLHSILSDIQELGFEGVELGGKFPREIKALASILDDFQLDLVGGWYSSNLLTRTADEEIRAMQVHLNLLKALGSTVFVIAETSNAIHGSRTVPLINSPLLGGADWSTFGERLSNIAKYVNDEGLKFAYHHHLGTVVEQSSHLEKFIDNTNDCVGLTLDTGHAVLGGIDPLDVIKNHPERIVHVHCKDVRPEVFSATLGRKASFLDGVLDGIFTVPGDGTINYSDVMKALKDMDYSGWIILEAEQDPALADPKTYAGMGLKTLRDTAKKVGLI